jgi:hypothetical protein
LFRSPPWIGAVIFGALALLLAAPGGAEAQDKLRITPAIEVTQGFDSNVGNTSRDEESDVVTFFSPSVALSHEEGRGHTKLLLGLRSRSYWDHSELNSVDRYVRGDFERMLTQRLTAFSNGRYEYFPDRDVFDDGGDPGLEGENPDWKRWDLSGGLRYALSPLSSISVSAGFSGDAFSKGDSDPSFFRRDRDSYFGSVAYQRYLSERDEVSLTMSYSDDRFDGGGTTSNPTSLTGEETNRVASAFASWNRAWTRRWSTHFAGGARWVSIDQDSIPGIRCFPTDCGSSDSGAGFVGSAGVQYETKLSELGLSYSRETRPSSGYGGNVDVGTVSGRFRRQLSQRMSVRGDAYYQRYASVGETSVPFLCSTTACLTQFTDSAIDADLLGANLTLDWRVGEHWTTFARYSYRDQTSEGDRDVSEYESHRVTFGFRYALPIDIY